MTADCSWVVDQISAETWAGSTTPEVLRLRSPAAMPVTYLSGLGGSSGEAAVDGSREQIRGGLPLLRGAAADAEVQRVGHRVARLVLGGRWLEGLEELGGVRLQAPRGTHRPGAWPERGSAPSRTRPRAEAPATRRRRQPSRRPPHARWRARSRSCRGPRTPSAGPRGRRPASQRPASPVRSASRAFLPASPRSPVAGWSWRLCSRCRQPSRLLLRGVADHPPSRREKIWGSAVDRLGSAAALAVRVEVGVVARVDAAGELAAEVAAATAEDAAPTGRLGVGADVSG